ncbi:DNA-packaging protein [Ancylobacter sp. VNQ12]|uniref:DNA-packaging protein n=1 Tax=Ancylobacter sp. VNQ12 TaxID=3400920 RepID=UPI003C0A6386
MNISSLARLPPEQISRALAGLTDDQCEQLLHDWRFLARDAQIAPADDALPDGLWQTWLILAGRGFGKTRTGAEWIREQVKGGATRLGLIAPTASDARDVMVEGESGILSVCWAGDRTEAGEPIGRPSYEPSKRRLTWANGAVATLFSAEEPERLRGPQHEALWCDELAAWKYLRETWDMAQFGLRLGARPRVCITTTPKPLKLIREIMADKLTVVTRGSTFDNRANLAPTFLRAVEDKYAGTRLGRQELFAEVLEEAEGALWTRQQLEAARHAGPLPEMLRVVIAVDPATTATEESDETGIVAVGLGVDHRGYVLEDASGRYAPDKWAKKALELFDRHKASRIVAEGNQGGDMVTHTIQTERRNAPVTRVHAKVGKRARAEPVAALYEQGKVSHCAAMPDLEDQMVIWEPLGGMPSPDRLDALVWGLTELMIKAATPTAASGRTRRN